MPRCSLREHSARRRRLVTKVSDRPPSIWLAELVEVMIPFVAENYASAHKLAMLILKGHRPPTLPTLSEPEVAAWQPPDTPVGWQRVYGGTL